MLHQQSHQIGVGFDRGEMFDTEAENLCSKSHVTGFRLSNIGLAASKSAAAEKGFCAREMNFVRANVTSPPISRVRAQL